jgi:hypothetical protein
VFVGFCGVLRFNPTNHIFNRAPGIIMDLSARIRIHG